MIYVIADNISITYHYVLLLTIISMCCFKERTSGNCYVTHRHFICGWYHFVKTMFSIISFNLHLALRVGPKATVCHKHVKGTGPSRKEQNKLAKEMKIRCTTLVDYCTDVREGRRHSRNMRGSTL